MDFSAFSLPLIVILLWTGSNSFIKKSLKSISPDAISISAIGMGLLPIFIFVFFDGGFSFSPYVIILGAISGVLLGSGYLLFYRGLGVESLSTAGVTLNIQQIVVITIGIFFLKESLNNYEYIAILFVILGAMLVTIQNAPAKRKFLIMAGIANVIWGIYYLPLSESILLVNFSALPLFMGRLFGFLFVLLVTAFLKRPGHREKINRSAILFVLAAGLLDGMGNVLYSYTIQLKIFIISGAIVALLPAILAITGFIYFKDRMTPMKITGILLSVLGALLISMT